MDFLEFGAAKAPPGQAVLRESAIFVICRLSLAIPHYDNWFHDSIWSRIESERLMVLVAIAWMYVVLMAAVVEATSANGTLLGAFFTLLLYGVLPVSIVGYLFLSPARKRARRAAEQASSLAAVSDPDEGRHAAGDPVAAKREEP